jgi:hypothetical protein
MTPLVLAAAFLVTQLPSIPTQQQAPRARVEGVVLRAGSTEPVVGARVTLARPGELNTSTSSSTTGAGSSVNLFQVPPVPAPTGTSPATPAAIPPLPIAPVLSDNAGKFAFSEVEAGTFRLFVHLDGFVRQEYGQRAFPGQGTPLNLNGGDILKDLKIQLTPAGNVGGRIVDNFGKPAAGVPLQLLRAVYNQAGQRTLQSVGGARTNDRGEYRFFWITPGRYYLAGGTPQGGPASPGGGASGSPNESGDSYTFTYYPGVLDISRANAIDVRPGGELVADFIVPKQQLYTIRGRIVDPALAIPPPSASIALAYQQVTGSNSMFSRNPLYNASTGAFELRDVLPGPYVIFANTLGGSARMPVEVVNANIEGVVLTVNSGISIAGRVSFEGGRLPSSTGGRLQLRPIVGGVPTLIGNFPSTQAINPDGTFVISNVLPGQYRIVPQVPTDFYLKEMRFDRFDALNAPIEVIFRGQDAPTIDVVLSPNVSQVEGVVNDARLQSAAGVTVVLIPDTNRDRVELYKTATTDQTGRFTLRSVAPGDYKLFAWEDLESNGYFDPDFLRRSESSGTTIRLNESSKLSVNVQVIPAN